MIRCHRKKGTEIPGTRVWGRSPHKPGAGRHLRRHTTADSRALRSSGFRLPKSLRKISRYRPTPVKRMTGCHGKEPVISRNGGLGAESHKPGAGRPLRRHTTADSRALRSSGFRLPKSLRKISRYRLTPVKKENNGYNYIRPMPEFPAYGLLED